jgi:hypothetical protein
MNPLNEFIPGLTPPEHPAVFPMDAERLQLRSSDTCKEDPVCPDTRGGKPVRDFCFPNQIFLLVQVSGQGFFLLRDTGPGRPSKLIPPALGPGCPAGHNNQEKVDNDAANLHLCILYIHRKDAKLLYQTHADMNRGFNYLHHE